MRRRRHTLQVSTFPFLAVLLCAMGSLILLLLVIDRRAKVVARAKTRAHQMEALAQQSKAEDDRQKQYEEKRQALRQRLQQQESALHANVNDLQSKLSRQKSESAQERSRTQELKARLASLRQVLSSEQESYLQAQQQTAAVSTTRQRALTEQEALSRQLVDLERALADVIAFRKRQSESYSVVPFLGKSGENRKPVYVECQTDQIIIHPERLSIKTERWDGIDPMQEVSGKLGERFKAITQGTNQKPYLLFLVRPAGIATYYQVMAALAPDKVDSGYELIEANWALDFGDKDGRPPAQPWVASASPLPPPAPTTSASRIPRSSGPVRGVPQSGFESIGSAEKSPDYSLAAANRRPELGQSSTSVSAGAGTLPGAGFGSNHAGVQSGNTSMQPGLAGGAAGPQAGGGPGSGYGRSGLQVPSQGNSLTNGNAANGAGTGGTYAGAGSGNSSGNLPFMPPNLAGGSTSPQGGSPGSRYGGSGIPLPSQGNSLTAGNAASGAGMAGTSPGASYGNFTGNSTYLTEPRAVAGGVTPGGQNGVDRGGESIDPRTGNRFEGTPGQVGGSTTSQSSSSNNSPSGSAGNNSVLLGLPGEVASNSRKPGDPSVPFADQPKVATSAGQSERGLFPLPGATGQQSSTGQIVDGGSMRSGAGGTAPVIPTIGSGSGSGGLQSQASVGSGSTGQTSQNWTGTGNQTGTASQDSGSQQNPGNSETGGVAQNQRENVDQRGDAIRDSKNSMTRTDSDRGLRTDTRADGIGTPDGVVQGVGQNSGGPANGSGTASSGTGGGQGGDGDPGDGTSGGGIPASPDPLAHMKPRPKRSSLPPSFRVESNRDLPLLLECHGNEIVFTATGKSWPVADLERNQATRAAFADTIQQWIARRQATVREGQTPYRPLLRFRVDPDGVRTYYAAYPAVEKLGIPMRRENVDSRPPAVPLSRP